jgi:hypothetical protein
MGIPDSKYTKGQQAFIQQRAHQMLVEWCDKLARSSDINGLLTLDPKDAYVRYACDRKSPWMSDKGGGQFKMLTGGWAAAASFLKR